MRTTFLLFLYIQLATAFSHADSPARPNILYFYVDDMGWGSLGPNAQTARKAAGLPYVKTPHLDELAAKGVNFTRAYGCTVCSPARSSQQTGFHQGHTFADRNDPDNARKAIRTDDITMGGILSKAGYATGYWGKWGYGGSKDMANPTIDNVQTLPTSHGYQHVVAELHHVRAHTFFQPTLWSAPAPSNAKGGLELIPNSMATFRGKAQYPNEPALQNHSDYPETAYCDDVYCFAALDFVRANAAKYNNDGTPFFGLLAVQVPHAPFDEIMELPKWDRGYVDDPEFQKLSDQTRQWAAMVTRVDGHFGNILKALEDPNGDGDNSDSVANNTLVIFQSDNGGPGGPSNKELDTNGGLRGNKGTIYEGGIRVPTLMRWPAKITANSKLKIGSSFDEVIDISDLLPTFCELAGAETPVGLDGVSFAPLLTGEGEKKPRDFLIHEAGGSASIIRGEHKLVKSKKGLELYDLEADHSESKNIAMAHPELVAELQKILLEERVGEPKGFANTYHSWIGEDGESLSKAANWSDYLYENEGETYLEDSGAPRLSWIARIENTKSERPATAIVDKDISFLGLQIRGGKGDQKVQVNQGVTLLARNELRLSKGANLQLDNSTISSLRWIEVGKGASIRGRGKVEGSLHNSGKVDLAAKRGEPIPELLVHGNYVEQLGSRLRIKNSEAPVLKVLGTAKLAGTLELAETPTESMGTILTADQVEGRFANVLVTAPDGTPFRIFYNRNAVRIARMPSDS